MKSISGNKTRRLHWTLFCASSTFTTYFLRSSLILYLNLVVGFPTEHHLRALPVSPILIMVPSDLNGFRFTTLQISKH
jgi:hypothetical protein